MNSHVETIPPIPPTAGPDFIAGFIYGMTGDNDLTEIEACYTDSKELDMWLSLAIGDLEKGGKDNEM